MSNNKLDYLEGRKIWGCPFYGTRLNLNPYTFSLCHEAQVGDRVLGDIKSLNVESYYQALDKLIQSNWEKDAPCRNCSKGQQYEYHFQKINYITVCTSGYCNSSCIYCHAHFEKENHGYNPIPYIQDFHDKGILEKDCYFDWGGGEPTLNPYFEETVQWLSDNQYQQRINTNAILFSEAAYNALLENKAIIRISIDSGTKQCFEMMKGHAGYDSVWNNVARYCGISNEVYIKYNVCNYNSDRREIEQFIKNCLEYKVRHILIDAEVNSYQPEKNAGPFYFTKKEFDAAHYLEALAKEKGLDVQVSEYAFSVRAEYDGEGNLLLPTQYYDNIDSEIISSGIKVITFPNMNFLIKNLREKKDYPLVIWGGGMVGRKIYDSLNSHKIKVDFFVDKNEELQKTGLNNCRVIIPEIFLEKHEHVTLILAGGYWKEMLQLLNKYKYDTAEVIYMPDIFFD